MEIRQKPGPKNALGKVKFLFPNRFDVYLHDTPSRSLFSRTVRSFSHGCIRVEKPVELAEYLLKDDPAWTPQKIAAALAKGREQWVSIPRPLPVHLVYWTAWADAAGTLQLRDDIYGRDKPLLEILGTQCRRRRWRRRRKTNTKARTRDERDSRDTRVFCPCSP